MQLSLSDITLFYKLWSAFLAYGACRYPDILGADRPYRKESIEPEMTVQLRNHLFAHPEVIDEFADENPEKFNPSELLIVRQWRYFVKGTFLIYRHLKKYTIFLDETPAPRAYGVMALASPFERFTGGNLPVMVEALLLPFKGQITYDGLLSTYNVTFGAGIRRSLDESYQRAKSQFGIIESLPFTPPEEEQSAADLLRFYMKSESNREQYWDEVQRLLDINPVLLPLYHQELGRIYTRGFKRTLKEHAVSPAWFAVLDNVIIASARTRVELDRVVEWLLPAGKREFVFVFQHTNK